MANEGMFPLMAMAEKRLKENSRENILIVGVRPEDVEPQLGNHERCIMWDSKKIKSSSKIPSEVGVVLAAQWMSHEHINKLRVMASDSPALLIECGGRTGEINKFLEKVLLPSTPLETPAFSEDKASEAASIPAIAQSIDLPVGLNPTPSSAQKEVTQVTAQDEADGLIPEDPVKPQETESDITLTEYIRREANFEAVHPRREIRRLFLGWQRRMRRKTTIGSVTWIFYNLRKVKRGQANQDARPPEGKKLEMPPEIAVQLAENGLQDLNSGLDLIAKAKDDLVRGRDRLRKEQRELIAEIKRLRGEKAKLNEAGKRPNKELKVRCHKLELDNARLEAENSELKKEAEKYRKIRSLLVK